MSSTVKATTKWLITYHDWLAADSRDEPINAAAVSTPLAVCHTVDDGNDVVSKILNLVNDEAKKQGYNCALVGSLNDPDGAKVSFLEDQGGLIKFSITMERITFAPKGKGIQAIAESVISRVLPKDGEGVATDGSLSENHFSPRKESESHTPPTCSTSPYLSAQDKQTQAKREMNDAAISVPSLADTGASNTTGSPKADEDAIALASPDVCPKGKRALDSELESADVEESIPDHSITSIPDDVRSSTPALESMPSDDEGNIASREMETAAEDVGYDGTNDGLKDVGSQHAEVATAEAGEKEGEAANAKDRRAHHARFRSMSDSELAAIKSVGKASGDEDEGTTKS